MLLISTTIKRGCHVSSFLRENGGTCDAKPLIFARSRRPFGGRNSRPRNDRGIICAPTRRALRREAHGRPIRSQPKGGFCRLSVGPGQAVLPPVPPSPARRNFKPTDQKEERS